MPNTKRKKPALKLPEIKPGAWRGEILGSCTVNFGQVVQPGPPRQSVEFTYMIMPGLFAMQEVRFTWPGVIMIMTPTPMKTDFPTQAVCSGPSIFPRCTCRLRSRAGNFRTCCGCWRQSV